MITSNIYFIKICIKERKKQNGKKRKQYFFNQFKDYINEDLLEEIIQEILKDERIKDVLASGMYHFYQLGNGYASDSDYDICVNVAMISWYYNKCKKRMSNENNENFNKKVINRFFEQSKFLDHLGGTEPLMKYPHIPTFCSMYCLCNSLIFKFDELYQKTQNLGSDNRLLFNYNSLSECIVMVKSIMLIVGSGDYNSSSSLLRTLIETLYTYIAINYKDKVIAEYYKFLGYVTYRLSNGNKYHPDVENGAKKAGIKEYTYEDYGWLEVLYSPNKVNSYSFKGGILNYVNVYEGLDTKFISKCYDRYSHFAHGDVFSYHTDWDAISDISSTLSYLMLRIYESSVLFLRKNKINCDDISDVYNNFKDVINDFTVLSKISK